MHQRTPPLVSGVPWESHGHVAVLIHSRPGRDEVAQIQSTQPRALCQGKGGYWPVNELTVIQGRQVRIKNAEFANDECEVWIIFFVEGYRTAGSAVHGVKCSEEHESCTSPCWTVI
jgi:hypothetical protein